jgi:deoxyribodipyrimidine photolyase-related protein
MEEISLVFPHQLFNRHPALAKGRSVFMIEDALFFNQYAFHLKKVFLHRASMHAYAEALRTKGYTVEYLFAKEKGNVLEAFFRDCKKLKCRLLHIVDPVDYLLRRRLDRFAMCTGIKIKYYDSPNFLNTLEELNSYFNGRKKYFLTDFYIDQRKKRDIMMKGSLPQGGKWTFDTENRKKLPRGIQIPTLKKVSGQKEMDALRSGISREFKSHYGVLQDFEYPITHQAAKGVLNDFLENRLSLYGTYQDAIHDSQSILYHSWITPAFNIGLLDPSTVVESVISHGNTHKIELNHLEGFVRQVIGWREFIRAVYEREGVRQRTTNFWNFKNPMPSVFWTGDTGLPPVDNVIKRLMETGYSNHIERLMILGNIMCLCEIDPDEVYRWFMTLYIDAYDWVMVPNVYGMSQFADGGLMSTKPYISGSNYISKMSHYQKGDWCATWDGLFWRFMHRHRKFFQGNPRLSMLLGTWDRMSADQQKLHLSNADRFLEKIHR